MANTTTDNNPPKGTTTEPKTLRVEIAKYKSLLDALGDHKKVARFLFTVALLGILIFLGISLVALAIKRFYPYSDISTNAFGVTTYKSENKEVSYWLLNTAELWAKSGIHVKAGQTITVRASGKKHSAVHHLYHDADTNSPSLTEPWVGTQGFSSQEDRRRNKARDAFRARYKLFPEENQDALLMQIVYNGNKDDRPMTWQKEEVGDGEIVYSNNRFIHIGDRQDNIYIEKDGELYFAVNDIVLDDITIVKMMWDVFHKEPLKNDKLLNLLSQCDSLRQKYENNKGGGYSQYYKDFLSNFGEKWLNTPTNGPAQLGKYGEFIELYGYYMEHYNSPWYDDNVGSFLVLVETVSD